MHICSRSLRFCLEKLTSAVHWQGHISDIILLQDLRRIFFHLRTDYNLMNGGVRVRSPHSAQVLLVCSKRELLGNDSFYMNSCCSPRENWRVHVYGSLQNYISFGVITVLYGSIVAVDLYRA